MSTEDKAWLKKCIDEPENYKMWVDNDCISVEDTSTGENVYSFSEYGYCFALQLLQHIGCNADMV